VAWIVVVRAARLALLDLDLPLIDAVEDAIALLGREPDAGHALRGRLRGLRALGVGSYRVLYQLQDDGRTVRVVATLHRSIAYRGDPR
jgi:mRNA interferase RelE/StbE